MVGVFYWSGTGNTEAMANAVAEGAKAAGQEVTLEAVSGISVDDAAKFDKLALGCADMGAEQLEEMEFEPWFTELEGKLAGKKVVIFGSWGWGGEWLGPWGDRVKATGAELLTEGLKINGTPDDAGLDECRQLGKILAEA